jgi:hypothetical protein
MRASGVTLGETIFRASILDRVSGVSRRPLFHLPEHASAKAERF